MENKKRCIVNYSSGGWYNNGSDRILRRLQETNYDGETLIFRNKLPVFSKKHSEVPYMFKPYAILEALEKGMQQIIWMDSSVYINKNVNTLFDIIEEQGYLILLNGGWNTGQWCSDNALEALEISREESFNIKHCMSGLFGFDFTRDEPTNLFYKFLHDAEKTFPGEWKNTGLTSKNPNVLGHRHDQTALSVYAHKANWNFTDPAINKIACYGKNEDYIVNFIPAI